MANLLLAALLPALLSGQPAIQTPALSTTVEGAYSKDGFEIKGLGVCAISEGDVVAWDMKGAPDAKLADRIKTVLQLSRSDLSFRFGVKNRWLVVGGSDSGYVGYQTAGRVSVSPETMGRRGGDGRFDLLRVEVPPSEKEIALTLSLSGIPGPEPAVVKFKEGEEVKYAGYQLKFGPTQGKELPKSKAEAFSSDRKGKVWSIVVGIGSSPDSYLGGLYMQALDEQMQPILYVDSGGSPVSPIKVLSDSGPSIGTSYNGSPNSSYRSASVQLSGPTLPGAASLYTTINPSKIRYLRLYQTRQEIVTITGFPADPVHQPR